MDIRLNTVGEIIEGDQKGWFVLVEFDQDNTGGYYIYQAPIPEVKKSTEGYDDWLESKNDVEGYFNESNWKIQWM